VTKLKAAKTPEKDPPQPNPAADLLIHWEHHVNVMASGNTSTSAPNATVKSGK